MLGKDSGNLSGILTDSATSMFQFFLCHLTRDVI